ncbi:Phage antirepressor protein [Streptococcus infantarius subsp. infantarius]|nr:Phage antirepressor protein [Streptococcus infantarius subsp. infantarius]MCO4513015.1 Phage antirepressor protein [Streptococcus infantarius subsp. infantarius]MCO4515009.1 Phage antirepressor protein [Streptococcus infantarius subsp. infantarius]
MMNVQVFNNEEFGQVRTLEIDGMVYFVGKDVAEVLGYAKARNAIANHVDDEDKKDAPIQGDLGGTQMMTIINESGLYSLILSSKLPRAKEFKRWVTSEVLPTIRKHGSYVAPVNPLVSTEDAFIQLFQTQKEIKQEQAVMRDDIVYLKEEQPVNPSINQDLTKERNKAVVKCLGGYDAPAYSDSKLRQKVFCQAAKDFKELFKIPRYDLLKKKDIDRAYDYWKQWQPQTNLRLEIEQANKQLSLSV